MKKQSEILLIALAARSKARVCVRLRAGIAGSKPTRDIYLLLVGAVCCQVVSSSGSSGVQRSPTDCGVSECNRKISIMKPWKTR
jgi:hypothetical protein